MSQYFNETYKNYYDKLTSSPINSKSLKDHIAELSENTKKLVNYIESTSWKEKGKDEVINNIIPKFESKIGFYIENINNNLIPASDKASNELYPTLEELNAKEAELEIFQQELESDEKNNIDNSSILPLYNKTIEEMKTLYSKANTTLEEIKKLNSLKNLDGSNIVAAISNSKITENVKVDNSKNNNTVFASVVKNSTSNYVDVPNIEIGKNVQENIDLVKKKIRSRKRKLFDRDFVEDFLRIKRRLDAKKEGSSSNKKLDSIAIKSASKSDSSNSKIDVSKNKNVTTWNTLGKNWIVTNTKFSVSDYANYAYSKGIRQDSNSSRYGDLCLAFSYVHASNMKSGSKADNAESAVNWSHAGEFYDYFSDNKQTTLTTIYNEILKGNPVIMQVNGNSAGTHRHFVTVVGFKDTVTSGQTIKESDLLILDSWDGKIETMDTNYSRFMTTGAQTGKTYSGYYLRLFK